MSERSGLYDSITPLAVGRSWRIRTADQRIEKSRFRHVLIPGAGLLWASTPLEAARIGRTITARARIWEGETGEYRYLPHRNGCLFRSFHGGRVGPSSRDADRPGQLCRRRG